MNLSKLLAVVAVLALLSALPILADGPRTCGETTLSWLGVRPGSLSPSFSSDIYAYDVEVDSDIIQLDFYPVTTDLELPAKAIWLDGSDRCIEVGGKCLYPSNIEVYIGSGTSTIRISVNRASDSTCRGGQSLPRGKDYVITVTRRSKTSSEIVSGESRTLESKTVPGGPSKTPSNGPSETPPDGPSETPPAGSSGTPPPESSGTPPGGSSKSVSGGSGGTPPGGSSKSVSGGSTPPAVEVSFGKPKYEVVEGDSVEITLKLNKLPQRRVNVPLTITHEGGASQDDYAGVPDTVRFASNEKQKKFTIAAEADDLAEDGEKLVIALGRLPSRVSAGPDSTTQVVLADVVADEEEEKEPAPEIEEEPVPEVSVSLSPVSVKVSEGTARTQFTVSLSAASKQQVTVRYATASRTAKAGEDYKASTGTLTFPAGTTEQAFGVYILDDAVQEEEEMFQVKLLDSNATIAEGTATVVITDNDDPPADEEPDEVPLAFAGAVADQAYTEGVAIRALQLPEATGGQGEVSYRVVGLPAGLSFDPATQTIAGTPTKATDGAVEVAFLAQASGATAALTFSITVNLPPILVDRGE